VPDVASPQDLEIDTASAGSVPAAPIPAAQVITLDLDAMGRKGFLVPNSRRTLLAEEYRVIKRPLLRAAFDPSRQYEPRDRTTLITSPHPGDGKTFTSINLAMSVASEHETHVLLIDTDVRQRGMSRACGVADRKGLMDVLTDPKLSVADVILRTNIPHLTILPAGMSVHAPTEILASQRMIGVIDEITRRYADRFVILDGPPALASSEPGVLAAYVGQVTMVVRANLTNRQAIVESLALVEACATVNFILNKVTASVGPDRFGYYGYGEER
jgi:receptor protein-tyrosine kinase